MNDTTFQGNGKVNYVPVVVNAKPPKPTNYDLLRAKSVDEMAEYYTKMCWCPPGNDPIFCGMATIGCKGCWLDWLKQEAAE